VRSGCLAGNLAGERQPATNRENVSTDAAER
jgi:hypothetical protein